MSVRPIQYTPKSEEYRAEIVAYAQAKGFRSASDFSLFAVENYMSRVGLTDRQAKKVEEALQCVREGSDGKSTRGAHEGGSALAQTSIRGIPGEGS